MGCRCRAYIDISLFSIDYRAVIFHQTAAWNNQRENKLISQDLAVIVLRFKCHNQKILAALMIKFAMKLTARAISNT